MTSRPAHGDAAFVWTNGINLESVSRLSFEPWFNRNLSLQNFFETDWNRAWLKTVDLDPLRERYLRPVGESQDSFTSALIANIDTRDEVERAQLVQLVAATG